MYSGCNLWYFRLYGGVHDRDPRQGFSLCRLSRRPLGCWSAYVPEEQNTRRPTDLKVCRDVSEFSTVFYAFEQGILPLPPPGKPLSRDHCV